MASNSSRAPPSSPPAGLRSPAYQSLLRQNATVAERCALIDAEKANYSVVWMCQMLNVARSSFYAWRHQVETAAAARRRVLAEHIRRIFDLSRQTYGCRRVAAALNREGHPASVGLVAELMRELGLRACQPRAYKRTTVPGEQPNPVQIVSSGTSPRPDRASGWSVTSPTSRPAKAGCIWPR